MSIRVEFTNIFNRLLLPTNAVAAPGGINPGTIAVPTRFTSGASAGAYSGGFRTVLSPLNGAVTGQRACTLVARFTFKSDVVLTGARRTAHGAVSTLVEANPQ